MSTTGGIRLIAGSKAGSLWFSQHAFKRAGSRDKRLHIVEGASSANNYVGPLTAHTATEVGDQQHETSSSRVGKEPLLCGST
jgi:hypothetical protein